MREANAKTVVFKYCVPPPPPPHLPLIFFSEKKLYLSKNINNNKLPCFYEGKIVFEFNIANEQDR